MAAAWVPKDYSVYLTQARKHFKDSVKDKNGVSKPCHKGKVLSLAWNCSGTRLASGSEDKTASIYTVKGGRMSKDTELRGHTDSVMQVKWNPSNEHILATASRDKSVRIWDHRSAGKCAQTIATEAENIGVVWSPDGNTIAVGNEEDVVEFFDTRQWKRTSSKSFNYEVNEMSWNNSGSLFVLTNGMGLIDILDGKTLAEAVPPMFAHTGNCVCVEFDPTGRYFATGGTDALFSLWDASELICVRTFSRQESSVRSLSFSMDGQLLAVASDDVVIEIAHVETGEAVHRIQTDNDFGLRVAWHPKQLVLAFSCDERDSEGNQRTGSETGVISLFGMTDKASS